jgi:hypothetical protein
MASASVITPATFVSSPYSLLASATPTLYMCIKSQRAEAECVYCIRSPVLG